jgi:hypothetical protein
LQLVQRNQKYCVVLGIFDVKTFCGRPSLSSIRPSRPGLSERKVPSSSVMGVSRRFSVCHCLSRHASHSTWLRPTKCSCRPPHMRHATRSAITWALLEFSFCWAIDWRSLKVSTGEIRFGFRRTCSSGACRVST